MQIKPFVFNAKASTGKTEAGKNYIVLAASAEEQAKRGYEFQAIVDTTKKTIELYCDGELFPIPNPVRDRLHEMLKTKCQSQPH